MVELLRDQAVANSHPQRSKTLSPRWLPPAVDNAVLHLLAIAHEAGVELTIDDSTASARTRSSPISGGRFVANDLYKAGGIQLVVRRWLKLV